MADKLKLRKSALWATSAIVLAILLVVSIATQGFRFNAAGTSLTGSAVVLTKEEAAQKAVTYLNDNFPQIQGTAKLLSSREQGGFYLLKLEILSQPYDEEIYITKDGSLLFLSAINLNPQPTQPVTYTKSDKPEVQLFVMSMCPYGVQAENAMLPVIQLLKDKVDFKLHFIVTELDNKVFQSLHGQLEVDEDLRQVAAMKNYPDKYMDYVLCQNNNYGQGKALGETWQQCATSAGIDTAVIENSIKTGEANTLLSENGLVATKLKVSSSPTIKINGQDYKQARTSEAMKTAICSAFNTAPAECSTALSSDAGAASGNCGY